MSAPAAPLPARLAAAGWWDLRTIVGNGEQVLVTAVIPVLLLVAMVRTATPDLSPLPQGPAALAAALAVAVVSSAFTGQSIALAFDRRSGLLRYLVTTPLGRRGVVAGRVIATAVLVPAQAVVLLVTAAVLGVPLGIDAVLSLVVVSFCGAAAFGPLGLLLGGTVRAEAVLAIANLSWLVMLALGGLVIPLDRSPGGTLVAFVPPGLLGEAARAAAVDGRVDALACLGLLAWGAVLAVLAGRLLRWR